MFVLLSKVNHVVNLTFLRSEYFLPLYLPVVSKQFAGSPKHANLEFMQLEVCAVSEFACETPT